MTFSPIMYHDMLFVPFLLFLRPVAGTQPLRDSFNDKPNDIGSLSPLSISPVSSLTPTATASQNLTSFSSLPASQSDRPLALIAPPTPRLVHHLPVTHSLPSAITNSQSLSTSIVPAIPFETHLSLSLGASHSTEGLPTQQSHLSLSSSTASESIPVPSQPSASPSVISAASTTAAPKIRFALIGVLAGVPALTVLGFFITMRWRRTRVDRGLTLNHFPPDCADLGVNTREGKGARFSSFFGVNNNSVMPSKNVDGRKPSRPVYASSIHSTSGLAGVGAHRGASANSAPPMIHYINVAEIGSDGELEKKVNFDNPFGTPPPICADFITAPSRVSPHLPHTPPQLINLPPLPTATHLDDHAGQFGLAISHPIAILSQNSDSRQASHIRNRGQNQQRWERVKDPIPAHVRHQQQPRRSSRLLSPDLANHVYTRTQNLKHPILPNPCHNPAPDVRTSIAPSVYGGLASPGGPAYKMRLPDPSPVLSYLSLSPNGGQTPVLPYLSSPVSGSDRPEDNRQGVRPVIVIEVSSPTVDSESEYADTDGGEEGGGLYVNEGSAHARRTGLIGSPSGFVAPSSTFSSVSSYSISGSGGSTASSSTSTIIPCESSASSALVSSSSSSGASSVTVKAVVVDPRRKIRMRDPDPERGGEEKRSVVSWSRNPRDIDKLHRDGLMGVAF